jgi:hypothetical protein
MLTIRDEQLAFLRAAAHQSFVAEQCHQWLLDDPSLDPQSVQAWIAAGFARARAYGFRSNRQLELFTDAMIVFGPEFDLETGCGWAHGILSSDTTDVLRWEAFRSQTEVELTRLGRR